MISSTTSTTKHPLISRSSVRNQLKAMGYENVEDAILDEMVHDLNQVHLSHSPLSMQDVLGSSPANVRDAFVSSTQTQMRSTTTANEITGEEVKRHLAAMGYDKDVPEQVVQELVHELNQPTVTNPNNLNLSRVRSKVQQQKTSLQAQAPLQRPPSSCGSAHPSSLRTSVVPRRPLTAMSQQQQQQQQRLRLKKRKNDPVNLYHQFQAEWSKSQFLKRLSDPNHGKKKMFGGVGYHRAMEMEREKEFI